MLRAATAPGPDPLAALRSPDAANSRRPCRTGSEEPLPKRVVEREGIVGDTVSIQAPTITSWKASIPAR